MTYVTFMPLKAMFFVHGIYSAKQKYLRAVVATGWYEKSRYSICGDLLVNEYAAIKFMGLACCGRSKRGDLTERRRSAPFY